MPHFARAVAVALALALALLPSRSAWADEGAPEKGSEGGDAGTGEGNGDGKPAKKGYDEMTPQEVRLEAVRLRQAINRLDRADTAAGYGFALRREARALVGGGVGVVFGTLAVSGLALALEPDSKGAPVLATVGVPLGLGVVVAGLPAMILAPRFLGWYAENGPAPSHLARLKLLQRWSLEELRVRRDTATIATGFFGVASILTFAVWGGRDRIGANGTPGQVGYDVGDAVTALSFAAVTAGEGAQALAYTLAYRDAVKNRHRLFLMPTVSLSPVEAGRKVAERLDEALPERGVEVRGRVELRF